MLHLREAQALDDLSQRQLTTVQVETGKEMVVSS